MQLNLLKKYYPRGGSERRQKMCSIFMNALDGNNKEVLSWLIETGYAPSKMELIHAIGVVNSDVFILLAENGAQFNAIELDYVSALIGREMYDAVRYALSKGAYIRECGNPRTVVEKIMNSGDEKLIRFTIENSVSREMWYSNQVLGHLIANKRYDLIEHTLLIHRGVIDVFDFLCPPIMRRIFDAILDSGFEMLVFFDEHGCLDSFKKRLIPNLYAWQFKDERCIDFFISKGFNFDSMVQNSHTELTRAVYEGNMLIAGALIDRGVDPYRTPYDNGRNCIWHAKDSKMLRFLVYKGVRVTRHPVTGLSGLTTQIKERYREYRVSYITDVGYKNVFAMKLKDGSLKFLVSRWVKTHFSKDKLKQLERDCQMPWECFDAIDECPEEIQAITNAMLDSELE